MNLLNEAMIRVDEPESKAKMGSSYAHAVVPQFMIKRHTRGAVAKFYLAVKRYRESKGRPPLVDAEVALTAKDVMEKVSEHLKGIETESQFRRMFASLDRPFLRLLKDHTTFYIAADAKGSDSKEMKSTVSSASNSSSTSDPELTNLTEEATAVLSPAASSLPWGGIGRQCSLCEKIQGEGSLVARWEISRRWRAADRLRELFVGKALLVRMQRERLSARELVARHIQAEILPSIKAKIDSLKVEDPPNMYFIVSKLWPLFQFYYIFSLLKYCQDTDRPDTLEDSLRNVIATSGGVLRMNGILDRSDIEWADAKGSSSSSSSSA